MAKRRRLTPAQPGHLANNATTPRPPIAQIVGEAALTGAFEDVQNELKTAQREGRMVLSLPLEAVQTDYMIRDRQACSVEDMVALKASLRARGQQMPIEVVALEAGRFGLISGWRRVLALGELAAETGDARFSEVRVLLRAPQDVSAAYVAMIEENEIRANLSFYERARIAYLAVQAGVYDSDKQALQTLFSAISFSKRSKIKSFIPIVAALDDVLDHPNQIPEKLGLALSKVIAANAQAGQGLAADLAAAPHASVADERVLLEQFLTNNAALETASKPKERQAPKSKTEPDVKMSDPYRLAPGVTFSARCGRGQQEGRVALEGLAINAGFIERLKDWLRAAS
ncbi:MAG: ParB N-terminal domain-containing protein [Rhodobacterales bacterium]